VLYGVGSVAMAEILHKLRKLDAYPKVNEDFYSRTFSGGVITLVSFSFMFFLFFSEISMRFSLSLFRFLLLLLWFLEL
jgi:hypothetical protein